MTELKRAKGGLLRGIRARKIPTAPGYMTQTDYQREDVEKEKRAKELVGFMDENAGGGGPPLLKWNGNESKYLKHNSDVAFNEQHFILNPAGAVAGYLKFKGKSEAPERHTGAIFPKDEAPLRSSLGDLDRSIWPIGKLTGQPEDPWTPVIELPLKHQETGEEYLLTC